MATYVMSALSGPIEFSLCCAARALLVMILDRSAQMSPLYTIICAKDVHLQDIFYNSNHHHRRHRVQHTPTAQGFRFGGIDIFRLPAQSEFLHRCKRGRSQ